MTENDEIITLEEVAKLTKFNKNYLRQVYNSWKDYGVCILKLHPNAQPRFYKSEILKMLESKK